MYYDTYIICVVVHHARRTRAHCPTMVSSFKLSSEAICLPRFCRFYQCSKASSRCISTQIEVVKTGQAVSSGLACVMHNATDDILRAVCPQLDIIITSGHRRAWCTILLSVQ